MKSGAFSAPILGCTSLHQSSRKAAIEIKRQLLIKTKPDSLNYFRGYRESTMQIYTCFFDIPNSTNSRDMEKEIPKGNTREDNRSRKQIIKDFYAHWISEHPDKQIWNRALNAFIHVKFRSINETSGQASMSYESTREVFRLTDILSGATLMKRMPPKRDDENQKPYSEILIMRQKTALLVVGKQKTTGEYVQYCISAKDKK